MVWKDEFIQMFPFIPNLVILHNVCSSSIIHLASFVCLVVVTFHGFFHGIHHYISPFGQICLELFTPTKSIKSNPSHPFMVYIPTFTNKNQPCKCRKIYRLSHGSESWISHPPRSSHPIGSIQGPSGRPGFDTILAWQPSWASWTSFQPLVMIYKHPMNNDKYPGLFRVYYRWWKTTQV